MKTALICGSGGFIGHHLVNRLKQDGFWVRGVDLKHNPFDQSQADEFIIGDLRDRNFCRQVIDRKFDHIYQLAADMGGAGFVFIGDNDADIMHNSASINLNVLESCLHQKIKRIFYSSSACIYPEYNQLDPDNPKTEESSAYPAAPDSEYGWEKLFSERLYLSFSRCYGLEVRIGRYHNIFGPEGSWNDGREKAPAAICRKIAMAKNGTSIKLWGSGKQTRSFLYIDECVEGTRRLMESDVRDPINIGSDEMVTIDKLAEMIMNIANKKLTLQHVPGPVGVNGRTSDNTLIQKKLCWKPKSTLHDGLVKTYSWISDQIKLLNQNKVLEVCA